MKGGGTWIAGHVDEADPARARIRVSNLTRTLLGITVTANAVELYGQNSFATYGYIPCLEEVSWELAIFLPGGTVEVRAEVSEEMLVVHVLAQVVGVIFEPVGLLLDMATVTKLSTITEDMAHFKAAMREFDSMTTMSGGSPAEFARQPVLSLQTEQAQWGQIFSIFGKEFGSIPKLVLDVLLVPFDDLFRSISALFGAARIDEDVVRFEVEGLSRRLARAV